MRTRRLSAAILLTLLGVTSMPAFGRDDDAPVVLAKPLTAQLLYSVPPLEVKSAKAKLTVNLPADAVLLFNGVPATGEGKVRTYDTPLLVKGQPYVYDLTAVIYRGRQTVKATERVVVWGGETTKVEFKLK